MQLSSVTAVPGPPLSNKRPARRERQIEGATSGLLLGCDRLGR